MMFLRGSIDFLKNVTGNLKDLNSWRLHSTNLFVYLGCSDDFAYFLQDLIDSLQKWTDILLNSMIVLKISMHFPRSMLIEDRIDSPMNYLGFQTDSTDSLRSMFIFRRCLLYGFLGIFLFY